MASSHTQRKMIVVQLAGYNFISCLTDGCSNLNTIFSRTSLLGKYVTRKLYFDILKLITKHGLINNIDTKGKCVI
jgi:hypothetical protein